MQYLLQANSVVRLQDLDIMLDSRPNLLKYLGRKKEEEGERVHDN